MLRRRNSALTVAQQALLAREGSVDVRLALLENVELDEQIKARVNSSLAKNSGAKSPEGMS